MDHEIEDISNLKEKYKRPSEYHDWVNGKWVFNKERLEFDNKVEEYIPIQERPTEYHYFEDGNWKFDRESCLNNYIRPIRNNLLNKIDTVYCNALNVLNMSQEEQAYWQNLKQELRDFPSTVPVNIDDLDKIIFPVGLN